MNRCRWLWRGLSLFFLLGIQAEDLRWQKTAVQFPEDSTLKEWVATYEFQNQSSHGVEIESIQSCCSCTTWKIEKTLYSAGERGKIQLHFDTTGKSGPQEKTVTIKTKQGESYGLTMKGGIFSLKEGLVISDSLLQWAPQDKRQSKQIRVEIKPSATLKIRSMTVSDPRFSLKITHQSERVTEIEVIPPPESVRMTGTLTIETDFPKKGEEVATVTLMAM